MAVYVIHIPEPDAIRYQITTRRYLQTTNDVW